MSIKNVQTRIDELFKVTSDSKLEDLRDLTQQLRDQYIEAARSLRRILLTFLLIWAAGYLVAAGIIEEGSVASFKVGEVKALLIGWPPLIGMLGYLITTTMAAENITSRAFSQCYKYLLPKAYEENLDYLLMASTFFGVERFLVVDKSEWVLRTFREI